MELLGLGARRDAEVVGELCPRPRVRSERGRRASRRRVRPHQHAQHGLVVGVLGEHCVRLRHHGRPVTRRERGFDLDPACRRNLGLAAVAGDLRPLAVLVGEERTADECERGIGCGTGDRETAGGLSVGGLVDAPVDLVDVEPGLRQRIAARAVDQVGRTEHATQARHEHPDLFRRLRRELLSPQHVRRPVHRDDLAARNCEQLEQRASLAAPEVTLGHPIDGESTHEPHP